MRLAVAQIITGADLAANLELIREYATRAKAAGAELVVFPEAAMRAFGHRLSDIAEPVDGEWAGSVRSIAKELDITVVAGMFTPGRDGRVRNTLLVTGPGVETSYDKIHLFDAFGFAESDTVSPGQDPLVVDIAGIRVGFAICYDLRFPGLFQTMADNGAQLHVISASWGAGPGKVDHCELLARARALDTTTFVAACDQASPVDYHGSAPRGVGHSLVAAPDGGVLGSLGAEPDLLTVDLELDTVDAVRRSLPVLANRRI